MLSSASWRAPRYSSPDFNSIVTTWLSASWRSLTGTPIDIASEEDRRWTKKKGEHEASLCKNEPSSWRSSEKLNEPHFAVLFDCSDSLLQKTVTVFWITLASATRILHRTFRHAPTSNISANRSSAKLRKTLRPSSTLSLSFLIHISRNGCSTTTCAI